MLAFGISDSTDAAQCRNDFSDRHDRADGLRCSAWPPRSSRSRSPAAGADPPRTLRVVLQTAETSFDPQFANDAPSDAVIDNVFEAMLDYDYLARPVRLVPRTLEAMPVSEDGGKTYLCRDPQGHLLHAGSRVQGQSRAS